MHSSPSVRFAGASALLGFALFALLALFPPHALDLAVSQHFFVNGEWPWRLSSTFEVLTHRLPKLLPELMAGGLLTALVFDRAYAARVKPLLSPETRKRLCYVLVSMVVSLLLVVWLKKSTGVACPWDVAAFGGHAAMTNPVWPFRSLPGDCWPSGHANTGFCLFALYFALRDVRPRLARVAFAVVLAFGLFCGLARVMQGAHFLSHVLATAILDYALAAALFYLFFRARKARTSLPRSESSMPKRPTGLILITTLWWTLVFNFPFFEGAAAAGAAGLGQQILLAGVIFFVSLALVSVLSLLPLKLFRALLVLLAFVGAGACVGVKLYGVAITPDMMRNVFATDAAEASGYLSVKAAALFLGAALPPAVIALWLSPALTRMKRAGVALGSLILGVVLIFAQLQDFSALMRNDRTLRYRIAPVNVVYSSVRSFVADDSPDAVVKRPVDPAPERTVADKDAVFVVVIGETTRAANWQLSGYARETNPQLSKIKDRIDFPQVVACGTSTDISLPCMLSRIGRSDYDRERILSEEALPGLLKRAGFDVLWIDNQSGCKGTCSGVTTIAPPKIKEDCKTGCLDTVLVPALKDAIAKKSPDKPLVVFLHMIGSHGPAYAERSSAAAKRFEPECKDPTFGSCSRETIVNAYDNSVRETDAVLAELIGTLKARGEAAPSGLVFMSDHGESLGEKGLYLHGAPYFVAPDEQTRVPGVLWMSQGFEKRYGVDAKVVRENAAKVSHEYLYSSVLGLLKVKSTTHRPAYDFTIAGKRP